MKEEPNVENLNDEFLEAYKSLDKICREIYRSDNNGVSSYIDDMERSWNGQRYIANWDAERLSLVKLRHIRNKLSHETGTMYMNDMCSKSDIEWLRNFRERILNREDPIALMRKIEQSQKATSYATPKSNSIQKSMPVQEPISVQEPSSYSRENFDNIFEIQKRKQLRLKARKTVILALVVALIAVLIIIGFISIAIKLNKDFIKSRDIAVFLRCFLSQCRAYLTL